MARCLSEKSPQFIQLNLEQLEEIAGGSGDPPPPGGGENSGGSCPN